jgi:CheY-like chemotaxis protein
MIKIKPVQILLVQPDEEEAEDIKNALDRMELYYEFSWARNPQEAMVLLKEKSLRRVMPDMVLIDDDMPGKTAKKLVADIRAEKEWRQCSCFLLVSPDASVKSGQPDIPGLSGYISKPFSISGAGSSGSLNLVMDLINRNQFKRF